MLSPELAKLARDAMAPMTKYEVMELTGLSSSTYERLRRGEVPGPKQLLKFAHGLGLDLQAVMGAAHVELGPGTIQEIVGAALQMTGLPAPSRLRIMGVVREEMEKHKSAAAIKAEAA